MIRLRRGGRLDKYRLEKPLGAGASSEVWLARDTVLGRKVALKIIPPHVTAEWGAEEIQKEARVAARLEHPNIATVRSAVWVDGYFLLESPAAERSLEGYMAPRRNPNLALSLIRDALAGLAYAHEHKVLHRDVKPGNILVYPGRVAKLCDFGTARIAPTTTVAQTEVGTLGYMAPEQAYGQPRYASDVFSLGLTAYELLTGRLPGWPFDWPLVAHERFEARTTPHVARVLRRALARNFEQRWPDAVAFQRALEKAIALDERQAPRKKSTKRKRRPDVEPFELESRWFKRKYGRILGLRYECHSCGGPIAEAMKICPWCGTDRNAFGEITDQALICPSCERGVRPEWTACPWCYPGRFVGNGRKPPNDPQAERSCTASGCEGQLRPFMRYCPICKTKVKRPWRAEGLVPCRKCRWPTSEHWHWCPWCGRQQQRSAHL